MTHETCLLKAIGTIVIRNITQKGQTKEGKEGQQGKYSKLHAPSTLIAPGQLVNVNLGTSNQFSLDSMSHEAHWRSSVVRCENASLTR
jgi:hypothetical protein